jgi:hypothetical protein
MKKLWILAILTLGIVGAACNQGDPDPTVGDADVTKDMPANQQPPASASARDSSPNGGSGRASVATPPPP